MSTKQRSEAGTAARTLQGALSYPEAMSSSLCSPVNANFCTISHQSCWRGRGRDRGSWSTSRKGTLRWWDHSGAELSVQLGSLLTACVSLAEPASTSPSRARWREDRRPDGRQGWETGTVAQGDAAAAGAGEGAVVLQGRLATGGSSGLGKEKTSKKYKVQHLVTNRFRVKDTKVRDDSAGPPAPHSGVGL